MPKNAPAPPPAAWLVTEGKAKEGDKFPEYDFPPPLPGLPSMIELAARNFFPNVEGDAPDWAKRASKMAFASAIPPTRKRKASEKYLEGFDCGKFSAAKELVPADMRFPSPEDYGGLSESQLALKLSSDQRADFFCGFRDGERCVREIPNRVKVVQTVKAYQAIAADWRNARECEGNAGKLHRWLIDKGAFHHFADPAATRTICRKIGFPTRSKAGSPIGGRQ